MSSFSLDAVERVIRNTIAASVGAVLAIIAGSGGWDAIDWQVVWKVAAFTALVSLLGSLAAKKAGSPDNASFLTPKP